MFYYFFPTLKENVTGIDTFPCETAIYPINIWDPLHIGQWHLMEVPEYVVIPMPKIKSKARLLDLMNVTFNGSSYRLTISDKLKSILEKYAQENIQFLPITLYHKKKYISYYWLTNIIKIGNEKLNYEKSHIELQESLTKISDITFKSYDDYLNYSKNLQWPNHLFITKLVLKKEISQHFFAIKDVYLGGIGYFISESLKEEIINAGCTGFEFEPVEQG